MDDGGVLNLFCYFQIAFPSKLRFPLGDVESNPQSKDFAMMQPECYEFEFQQTKFRREEDSLTYDELLESMGLKIPTASDNKKPSSPIKKSSSKSSNEKAENKKKSSKANAAAEKVEL